MGALGLRWRRLFLSTPSVRRATSFHVGVTLGQVISIHALREEGDSSGCAIRTPFWYFYPRPP